MLCRLPKAPQFCLSSAQHPPSTGSAPPEKVLWVSCVHNKILYIQRRTFCLTFRKAFCTPLWECVCVSVCLCIYIYAQVYMPTFLSVCAQAVVSLHVVCVYMAGCFAMGLSCWLGMKYQLPLLVYLYVGVCRSLFVASVLSCCFSVASPLMAPPAVGWAYCLSFFSHFLINNLRELQTQRSRPAVQLILYKKVHIKGEGGSCFFCTQLVPAGTEHTRHTRGLSKHMSWPNTSLFAVTPRRVRPLPEKL